MSEKKTFLRMQGICKQFNGIPVLRDVGFDVREGEVHALMGENGAGKSTLIKIITGVYKKDEGDIFIDGEHVEIDSRQDARAHGISVIYQELSLIPALTVTENIFLGQEISRHGISSKRQMRERVQSLIEHYGFDLRPDAVVETMGMAQRQLVEVLKALAFKARLIIMDEPTSSLSAAESEKLFETIDGLRNRGASILYISHRLEEVYRLSDRLTVMRDGQIVGVLGKDEIEPHRVTTMMIGREVKSERSYSEKRGDLCLDVQGLSYKNLLRDISFKAWGGEILGIGGLVGSGRTELIKCIYGAYKRSSGTVTLDGKPVDRSIRKNIRAGFGLVPEDRRGEGFIPDQPIEKNLAISSYDKLAKFGIVNRRREIEMAETAIKRYDIRPALRYLHVTNLSGGNQQKVVLGRWLSRSPRVLLLDEPTAGVDVGVKMELYDILRELAATGAIVIMVSSDLVELTSLSDRVLIIHEGRIFEEFSHENVTQAAVLLAASGVHSKEGVAL